MSQGPVIASLSAVLLITVAPSSSGPALAAASTLQSDSPARAAVARGFRSYDAGRYDAARIEFEQALEHAREADDRAAEADARRGAGMVLYKKARYADAHTELLAALQLYETIGDHAGAGRTLHHLGRVAYVHETGAAADQYWTRG